MGHILPSEEYQERRKSTLYAYPVILKISETFLSSVKDFEVANSLPIPNYGKAICFTYRFLGESSIGDLPKQGGDKLNDAIDTIFFSGLNFHFFWGSFPSRKEYKNVNTDELKNKWLSEALVADQTMRNFYPGEGGPLSKDIFDKYYSSHCLLLLKSDLKIGFFKRGMCKSFFRNIYSAGALLGVRYDLSTKQQPSQGVIGVAMETLVKDWLAQVKGRQYRELIQHHVRRMDGPTLASAVIGHIKELPGNLHVNATQFIIEYGRYLLEQDSDIWGLDCVDVYHAIMANAVNIMPELEEYAVDRNQTTDGPIWTIFNALTLSISGAAADNKPIRKLIGVRKGLFSY